MCVFALIAAVADVTQLLLGMSWEDSYMSHHHISWNWLFSPPHIGPGPKLTSLVYTHMSTHWSKMNARMCTDTHRHLVLPTSSITVKLILNNPLEFFLDCRKSNKWHSDFCFLGQDFNEISDRLNKFSKTQRNHQSMTVLKRWERGEAVLPFTWT